MTQAPNVAALCHEIDRKISAGVDPEHLSLLIHSKTGKAMLENICGHEVKQVASGRVYGCTFMCDDSVPLNSVRVLMGNDIVAEWAVL